MSEPLKYTSRVQVFAKDRPGECIRVVSSAHAESMVKNGAKALGRRTGTVRAIVLAKASDLTVFRGEEHLMNAPRAYHDKPLRPPIRS